jgi:hypothetical protein
MVRLIKGNGIWVVPMGEVYLLTLGVRFMKVSGNTIKLKAMEYMSIPIMLDMKVNGSKIYSMVKVQKNGKMDQFLSVNTVMEKRTD